MKKTLTGIAAILGAVTLTATAWGAVVSGELLKIDGSFYVVKDAAGKEHKIHFDDSTKKAAEIKAGMKVEIDEANGHAKSIQAAKAEMEKK